MTFPSDAVPNHLDQSCDSTDVRSELCTADEDNGPPLDPLDPPGAGGGGVGDGRDLIRPRLDPPPVGPSGVGDDRVYAVRHRVQGQGG